MSDKWTLYYWPNFAGRAEFVRLCFEELGVKYDECNDPALIRQKIILGKGDMLTHFAPPVIKKGDFELGQTHVICRYLAEKYGLCPSKEKENARAEEISLTCHDFIAEGRLAFHAIDSTGSYASQKEATQPFIEKFAANRLPRWLKFFERMLLANNGGKGFVVGDKCSYADLALLHVLRATAAQFPEAWAKTEVPTLKAFVVRISERPKLAAYFKSNRVIPFCGDSMM